MQPIFITKDEFTVVGIECISSNKSGEFGQLWQDFLPRMGKIRNPAGECGALGICGCGPKCEPEKGICKCGEAGMSYMAAIEASNVTEIPEGMVSKTIPANKYAVFTHKGSLDKLCETYNYIYQTGLQEHGCEMAGFFCFELYDERFNPSGENSELDIYVPVK